MVPVPLPTKVVSAWARASSASSSATLVSAAAFSRSMPMPCSSIRLSRVERGACFAQSCRRGIDRRACGGRIRAVERHQRVASLHSLARPYLDADDTPRQRRAKLRHGTISELDPGRCPDDRAARVLANRLDDDELSRGIGDMNQAVRHRLGRGVGCCRAPIVGIRSGRAPGSGHRAGETPAANQHARHEISQAHHALDSKTPSAPRGAGISMAVSYLQLMLRYVANGLFDPSVHFCHTQTCRSGRS